MSYPRNSGERQWTTGLCFAPSSTTVKSWGGFNKILKDQLQQLQQEVLGIEMRWRMQLNLPPFATVSPKAVMDQMQAEIRQLKREVAVIKQDLHTFQDIELLKGWLKSYKIPKKHEMDDLFGGGSFPFGY